MKERIQNAANPAMAMQQAPINYQAAPQQQGPINYMAVPSDNFNYPVQAAANAEAQLDKAAVENEHIRYLNETKKQAKKAKKAKKDKKVVVESQDEFSSKAGVNKAAERSADLIEARMRYDAGIENTDLEIEFLKFTEHSDAQKNEYIEYKRNRAKIVKSVKKAKKLEKKATKRYYSVLAKESASLTLLNKNKKQDELSIVLTRLETLIKQRENIDARLSTLYKGADTEAGGKVRAAAEQKKLKKAKKVQKSLKATNRRVEKMDIPEALKSKIRFLLNTKITTEAALVYSNYLLKKLNPKGEIRKNLKKNIKSAESSLKRIDDGIKRLINKAERYLKDRKRKNFFLKAFVVVALAAVVVGIIAIA